MEQFVTLGLHGTFLLLYEVHKIELLIQDGYRLQGLSNKMLQVNLKSDKWSPADFSTMLICDLLHIYGNSWVADWIVAQTPTRGADPNAKGGQFASGMGRIPISDTPMILGLLTSKKVWKTREFQRFWGVFKYYFHHMCCFWFSGTFSTRNQRYLR